LKKFLRMPDFEEHLELHRLDCLASNGNLENYDLARRKLEENPEDRLRPPRLLTGADLIAEGYEPGPQFSQILTAVEDAQLEGKIGSTTEAIDLVRETFPLSAPNQTSDAERESGP